VPVVATPLIANQVGWQRGRDLLAAADPEDFAEACIRLHRDEALWWAVRDAALERCRIDCSPATFQHGVQAILDAVVKRRRPAGAA
jgi:O-antigen biosynthesis protein